MTKTTPPETLLQRIRSGHRFLLTSHLNPDGDAIGSALGLARILRSLGKGAVIWNRDETPGIYQPLPGSGLVRNGEAPPSGFPETFDAVIVLECPTPDRTGLEDALGQLPILNIDHHLGNQHYGVVNWVDPGAPAVGEMVYRLAQSLLITPDPDTATLLYLTLVTDTGGFRFSNATAQAFDAAAALVRAGARPEQVSGWIYESRPLSSLRLLARMLDSLGLHSEGRVATAHLTRKMFADADAAAADSEGLVDYPRSIAGVEAAALLREVESGTKVSLRSRGAVDVERVARKRGGGGHKNAAGFNLSGSPADVEAEVVAALTEALATAGAETADA